MSFLAPSLLFGLGLATLPVIIHLLNRRRFKHIRWAAMEFLLEAVTAKARRLRLQELLLMALRVLAVALFGLALARPVLSGGAPSGGDAILLLDRSASMRYTQGAGSLFDFAKARALEILTALGRESRVLVAVFDSRVDFPAGIAPVSDPGVLRDVLEQAEAGWGGTDYALALREAARAARGFPSRSPVVFLISDFRLGAERAAGDPLKRGSGALYLVPVAGEDGSNVGITALAPAGRAFTAAGGLVQADIADFARVPAGVGLSVSVDAGPATLTRVTAEPGLTVKASVAAEGLAAPGAYLVEATIPDDAYAGDDRAFAVVRRRPLRLALSVGGKAREYITAALSSAPEGSFDFVGHTNAPGADDVDGFIFAGKFPPGEAAAAAVWKKVAAGAFAVVFLDGRNAASAAAFLGASGIGRYRVGRIPARGITGDFHPVLSGSHPVTAFIRGQGGLSLAGVTLRAVADLPAADDTGGNGDVETPLVVETPGGKVALLEFARFGKGVVAVFNNSADRAGGDLVLSPFFLPLLFETVAYVAPKSPPWLNTYCGRAILVPAETASQETQINGPSGKVDARLVAAGGGFAWSFTPREPGFYRLKRRAVAANVAPSESEVRSADPVALERAFGGKMLAEPEDFASAVARGVRGREISGYLVAAALGVLVLEMLLVWVFKRGA